MVNIARALRTGVSGACSAAFSLLGCAGFSLGETEHTVLRVYDGIPYLAFVDVASGYRVTVMEYHPLMERWVPVGEAGFSNRPANYTCLYVDNGILYVAFKQRFQNSKVVVMKYDGYRWEQVGDPAFGGAEINYISLFVEAGIPYVAFTESSLYRGRVMKYDPAEGWIQIGGNISDKFVGYISLYVDQGVPYVAYTEGDNIPWCQLGKLAVSKYGYDDATGRFGWHPVGNHDFFGIAFYTSLYVDRGVPYVAYGDGNELCKISVARCILDAERGEHRWTYLGKPGFSQGNVVYPKLDIDQGVPYVAFRDDCNGFGATLMKYDGTRWLPVGQPGFSAGEVNYLSLQVQDGRAYLAYADGTRENRATVVAVEEPSSAVPIAAKRLPGLGF